MLGPTGISAVNICGTIIHSGLEIKTGLVLHGLSDKSKAASGNKLSEEILYLHNFLIKIETRVKLAVMEFI